MSCLHGLPSFPDSTDKARNKLCFVIPGSSHHSPGRLTRFVSLANLLVGDGHQVELAVWIPYRQSRKPIKSWLAQNCVHGIGITYVPSPEIKLSRGMLGLELYGAFNTYSWLKNKGFEAIYFFDQGGLAYHCLTAKQAGLEFHSEMLIVVADVPSLMNLEANKSPIEDAGLLVRYEMERKCFELADQLLLFNESIAEWMTCEGIQFNPAKTAFEYPCFLPSDTTPTSGGGEKDRQLVFWGDISVRSGFPLFCASLARLPSTQIENLQLRVYCRSPEREALKFAKRQFAQLDLDVFFSIDCKFQSIIKDLLESTCLVFSMDTTRQPSFEQIECLARGIPVISLDCDANRRIYETAYHQQFLFEPRPATVAQAISNALGSEFPTRLMSLNYADCRDEWLRWQRELTVETMPSPTCSQPKVTICLMHHERPQLVAQAIESIEAQTYPYIEVVLLDDGSTSTKAVIALKQIEERFQAKGWQVVRQENKYLGAARNTAARHANGTYLFFLDDDNILEPVAIETLVKVAQHSQSDIVGSYSYSFTGQEKPDSQTRIRCLIAHMGAGLEFGLFKNPYADSNSLISKEFFGKIGGNTEDYGVGKDDQEFYARALLADAKMIVVPEPLYWARQLDTRLRHRHFNRYAGQWRVSQPYLRQVPANMRNIIRFSQSAFDQLYMEPVTLLGIATLVKQWLVSHFYASARGLLKQLRKFQS